MVTSLRVCHLRIPVKVPSALNVSRSKKRPLSLTYSTCHVPAIIGVYCFRNCSVFSCASSSAHCGSLLQEARATRASRMVMIVFLFISFYLITFLPFLMKMPRRVVETTLPAKSCRVTDDIELGCCAFIPVVPEIKSRVAKIWEPCSVTDCRIV